MRSLTTRCARRPLPYRLLVIAAMLLAIAIAPLAAAEPLTVDGLLSKLDKHDRVTLTAADGTERDITVAEMEQLAREQHAQQQQMQREAAAAQAARTAAETGEPLDGEDAPARLSESLDAIRQSDPRFAANIALAQSSFAEIQRHGYARGYALAGFSEKDEAQKTKMTVEKKKKTKGGKQTTEKTTPTPPREDYTAALVLRAERRAGDRKARTGTSAHRRDAEPLTVSYEVSALLDANDQFALLAAWELTADGSRGTRLSIKPNQEVVSQQQQRVRAAKPWFFQRADVTTWVLAGGVALIGAGLVVLYTSQQPAPVTRRNSADNWELAPSKKTKKTKTKKSEKSESKKTN